MGVILLSSLAVLPFLAFTDPAPGMLHTRSESRTLDCERMSAEMAEREHPGTFVTSGPRGDYIERDAVVCHERLMRPGLRAPRDEAILSTLDARVTELANAAESRRPDLAGRTWLVEAHYPNAQVASKLSFAAKNALVSQGLSVSDRTVRLAAGDIGVITRMDPEESYAAACKRYAANGSLGEGDALLAVISLDPRETILHAGLCSDGQWSWLR